MKLLSVFTLSRRAAIALVVAVLAVGTAVGTFASQDMLPGQSQDSPSVQVVDDDAADNDTGQRDIVGIPEDNPVHQPAATPEACEKGETAVKTTPSGEQVNVPCHALDPGPPSFSQGHQGDNGHGNNGDDSDKDGGGNG